MAVFASQHPIKTEAIAAIWAVNSSRITASELSLQLHQVPTVSIKVFEDCNDSVGFFAWFLAE
jgi:hypothetical protein